MLSKNLKTIYEDIVSKYELSTQMQNENDEKKIDFLLAYHNRLIILSRELTIMAYSKSNIAKNQDVLNLLNANLFAKCVVALKNMKIEEQRNDAQKEEDRQIINSSINKCCNSIMQIAKQLAKLSNNKYRENFFNPHYNYSLHSTIEDYEFELMYEKYLRIGCYASDHHTKVLIKYFITGENKPIMLDAVQWLQSAEMLQNFLKDMHCTQSIENKEVKQVFLLSNRSFV